MQNDAGITTTADLTTLDNALADTRAIRTTRRALLGRAAIGLASVSGAAAIGSTLGAGSALAATSTKELASALATNEAFGTTFLTHLIQKTPGHPANKFATVLRGAAQAEYDHLLALESLGGSPLATTFWIPNYFFGDLKIAPFNAIEQLEQIEISAYLAGVTAMAKIGNATGARILAEAMGTECEHLVLARSAQDQFGHNVGVPNNRSFESFTYQTIPAVQAALARLGIGIGKQGSKPGAFYTFPGNPKHHNAGASNINRRPQ